MKPKKCGGLGLKSMQSMNKAALTKLGWRWYMETDSLWAQMLKAKYGTNESDLVFFHERFPASNTWQGLVSVALLSKKACKGRRKRVSGLMLG